jgi:hypothetical protein
MSRNSDLYAEDFYTWTQTTAAAIRAGKWARIDREAVAAEIESLGVNQEGTLYSHLKQLVTHLLKWAYQPARRHRGHGWESTIIHTRSEIAWLIARNPGLAPRLEPLLQHGYPTARHLARAQTGVSLTTFPLACPWTIAQVLHDDFWPEGLAA